MVNNNMKPENIKETSAKFTDDWLEVQISGADMCRIARRVDGARSRDFFVTYPGEDRRKACVGFVYYTDKSKGTPVVVGLGVPMQTDVMPDDGTVLRACIPGKVFNEIVSSVPVGCAGLRVCIGLDGSRYVLEYEGGFLAGKVKDCPAVLSMVEGFKRVESVPVAVSEIAEMVRLKPVTVPGDLVYGMLRLDVCDSGLMVSGFNGLFGACARFDNGVGGVSRGGSAMVWVLPEVLEWFSDGAVGGVVEVCCDPDGDCAVVSGGLFVFHRADGMRVDVQGMINGDDQSDRGQSLLPVNVNVKGLCKVAGVLKGLPAGDLPGLVLRVDGGVDFLDSSGGSVVGYRGDSVVSTPVDVKTGWRDFLEAVRFLGDGARFGVGCRGGLFAGSGFDGSGRARRGVVLLPANFS